MGKLHGFRAAALEGKVPRCMIDTHHEHIGDFRKQARRRACARCLCAKDFADAAPPPGDGTLALGGRSRKPGLGDQPAELPGEAAQADLG